MKVTIVKEGEYLVFHLETDEHDNSHLNGSKISLAKTKAHIKVGDIEIDDIPADMIGLSTILMCHQFIGKYLELPVKVSSNFLNQANSVLSKYKIISKSSEKIERFQKPANFRPGLAYSGGVDSCAALAIMPGNTIPVFLNRPMTKKSMYDSDAPLKSCIKLRELGYDVQIIDCDIEYLRQPTGFPSDLANAIPAILLAKKLGLGSISFGTVFESAYGIGHEKYIEYELGSHWRFFGTLFKAAGIKLSLPVAGISEVGTAIITNKSPLGRYSQSCIRGKWDNPCLRCWKCFRKELLLKSLYPDKESDIEKMLYSSEVQIRLSAYPISHENVILFSIQRIDMSENKYLKILKNRLDTKLNLNGLEKWYSPSLNLIPKKWRNKTRLKILNYLKEMSEEEQVFFQQWDMEEFLHSGETKMAHEKLTTNWQNY